MSSLVKVLIRTVLLMTLLGVIICYGWATGVSLIPILRLNPQPTARAMPTADITHDLYMNRYYWSGNSGFGITLNATLDVYNSRLDGSLPTTDRLNFGLRFVNGEPSPLVPAYLSGGNLDARWSIEVVFPWPTQPLQFPITYTIHNTISVRGGGRIEGIGPAGAEFLEYAEQPWSGSDPDYSGRCRHYVDGYITLLSTEPLVGEFQFFCQFDSTDYAQVSGRFWE